MRKKPLWIKLTRQAFACRARLQKTHHLDCNDSCGNAVKESPSKLPDAENSGPATTVSDIWLFCECAAAQYLHTLSSCPGLQQCLHTGAALSQDGCLDRHADAHMHTRPLCRHTAPPRSVVLCYAPGRQNWGVTCTDEASIWGWYFVVICFKPAQGTLPEPHALQGFFICCHLHQFLWNRRE